MNTQVIATIPNETRIAFISRIATIMNQVLLRHWGAQAQALGAVNIVIDVPACTVTECSNETPGSSRPAASCDPKTRSLTVHPYLVHRRTPKYVLEYLCLCAADVYQGSLATHYAPLFRHREKALGWLFKRGFPTAAALC